MGANPGASWQVGLKCLRIPRGLRPGRLVVLPCPRAWDLELGSSRESVICPYDWFMHRLARRAAFLSRHPNPGTASLRAHGSRRRIPLSGPRAAGLVECRGVGSQRARSLGSSELHALLTRVYVLSPRVAFRCPTVPEDPTRLTAIERTKSPCISAGRVACVRLGTARVSKVFGCRQYLGTVTRFRRP